MAAPRKGPRPDEKIVILDRANAELAFPATWTFKPDPAGHMTLVDPSDSCKLEVSYFRLPRHAKELPPLDVQIAIATEDDVPRRSRPPRVTSGDRGDLWYAFADSDFECDDTDRGEPGRKARSRILLATNGLFQVLMTFGWWVDDDAWAVPAFDRIFATLRLGDGRKLASPRDHWTMRDS